MPSLNIKPFKGVSEVVWALAELENGRIGLDGVTIPPEGVYKCYHRYCNYKVTLWSPPGGSFEWSVVKEFYSILTEMAALSNSKYSFAPVM